MKRLFIGSAIVLFIAIGAHASQAGNTIKIYVSGRDAQSLLDDFNSQMDGQSIRLEMVELESEADVSVAFRDEIRATNADAVSYAYRGHIDIANSAPASSLRYILAHELLHCAGVDHEDDPSSVMYEKTGPRQLKPEHIKALRRLAGITPVGRFVAQMRVLF